MNIFFSANSSYTHLFPIGYLMAAKCMAMFAYKVAGQTLLRNVIRSPAFFFRSTTLSHHAKCASTAYFHSGARGHPPAALPHSRLLHGYVLFVAMPLQRFFLICNKLSCTLHQCEISNVNFNSGYFFIYSFVICAANINLPLCVS